MPYAGPADRTPPAAPMLPNVRRSFPVDTPTSTAREAVGGRSERAVVDRGLTCMAATNVRGGIALHH